MKYPFLFIISVFIAQFAAAQSRFDFTNHFAVDPGFELGIPSQSVYSVGLGGSLKFEIPVAGHFSAALTGGISSFSYKSGLRNSFDNVPGSDTFVPLKAGVRYFAAPGFYLDGELGETFQTTNDQRGLFAFALGPGFLVPVAHGKSGVDIGFRYESWSDHQLRQTAVRVGYRF